MKTCCTVRALKVFIVEDSASIRERLTELMGEIDGAAVVGFADAPSDAIAGILNTRPDCVVLDYQLAGGTGVDVLHAVRPKAPGVVFVVLTNHANPQYRRLCMEAGATWFFDKSTEFRKIKGVVAGLTSLSEQ
ncbi:MAG TPA: response regulator transcription factor [Casimicrobiaceae bacterium]|jgi:two-component system response regulator DevR|nr:response regulator transcription factor [Casimicrobiaceae bacterium]